MKKIYICGRVTDLPRQEAVELFSEREKLLRNAGYTAMNPMRIVPPNASWKNAMEVCICHLMQCDGYTCLPNWKESKGARLEVQIAEAFGLTCVKFSGDAE